MAGKSPQSRTPLARMMRIHQQLIENRYPNCSSMGKDIEVSTKTIQRDIDYMRYQLELPLEYDQQRHGYYYAEPVTHFPTIPATEGEVLALFVAQKALQQYRGTPFEEPLANAFAKLTQVMGEEVTVNLQELSEAMSFHHTGAGLTDMQVFQKVTEALREHRELSFSYRKLNSNRSEDRRVQPYHLGSIDGQWYLFANDLSRDDMRTFVLGRIRDVPQVGRKFKKDKEFSLRKRLMGSFGVYSGEGNFKVQIEFDTFAAQLIRERTWHGTQEIEELAEGGLVLTVCLDSLEEIESWVLGWGSHARVLGPAELKKRVRAAVKGMESHYIEGQKWFSDLHEAAQANQPDRLLQLVMGMDRSFEAPGQMSLRLGAPEVAN